MAVLKGVVYATHCYLVVNGERRELPKPTVIDHSRGLVSFGDPAERRNFVSGKSCLRLRRKGSR